MRRVSKVWVAAMAAVFAAFWGEAATNQWWVMPPSRPERPPLLFERSKPKVVVESPLHDAKMALRISGCKTGHALKEAIREGASGTGLRFSFEVFDDLTMVPRGGGEGEKWVLKAIGPTNSEVTVTVLVVGMQPNWYSRCGEWRFRGLDDQGMMRTLRGGIDVREFRTPAHVPDVLSNETGHIQIQVDWPGEMTEVYGVRDGKGDGWWRRWNERDGRLNVSDSLLADGTNRTDRPRFRWHHENPNIDIATVMSEDDSFGCRSMQLLWDRQGRLRHILSGHGLDFGFGEDGGIQRDALTGHGVEVQLGEDGEIVRMLLYYNGVLAGVLRGSVDSNQVYCIRTNFIDATEGRMVPPVRLKDRMIHGPPHSDR